MNRDEYLQVVAWAAWPQWERQTRENCRRYRVSLHTLARAWDPNCRVGALALLLPEPEHWTWRLEESRPGAEDSVAARTLVVQPGLLAHPVPAWRPSTAELRAHLLKHLRERLDLSGWPPCEDYGWHDFPPEVSDWMAPGITLSREAVAAGHLEPEAMRGALVRALQTAPPTRTSEDPYNVTVRTERELADAFNSFGLAAGRSMATLADAFNAWDGVNRSAEQRVALALSETLARMVRRADIEWAGARADVESASDLRAAQEFEPGQEFNYSGSGLDADQLADAARMAPAIGHDHDDPAQEAKPTRASALPWDEWVKRSAKVLGDNPSVFPAAEAYVSLAPPPRCGNCGQEMRANGHVCPPGSAPWERRGDMSGGLDFRALALDARRLAQERARSASGNVTSDDDEAT